MILIFSIFSFGENYYCDSNSIWTDLIVNFSGALIGAALGFISAFLIFRIQYTREKNDFKIKEEQDLSFHYYFMIDLLNDSIIVAKNQIDRIKEHIENINADPFNIHEIDLYLYTEVNRLLKFESDYTYKAFLFKLSDNEERFTIYKKVFNHVDYLSISYKQIDKMQEKYCESVYSMQLKTKTIINDLAKHIALTLGKIESKSQLHVFLDNKLKIYNELTTSTTNLFDYEEKMLYDLREKIVKEYNTFPFLDIILWKAKEAATLLNDIKFESENTSEDFNTQITEYAKVISMLDNTMIILKK